MVTEERKAYNRKYYQEHQEESKAYARKYRQEHQEQCLTRMHKYRQEHHEELKAQDCKHRQDLKYEVIAYYSLDTMRCLYCGEDDIIVLQIDHIDGNGNKHRRSLGKLGGNGFYRWVIKNNFPDGFQVLCANCNTRKRWDQQEYGVRE